MRLLIALCLSILGGCAPDPNDEAAKLIKDAKTHYSDYVLSLSSFNYNAATTSLQEAIDDIDAINDKYPGSSVALELARDPAFWGGHPREVFVDSVLPYLHVLQECKTGSSAALEALAYCSSRPRVPFARRFSAHTWPPSVSPTIDKLFLSNLEALEAHWEENGPPSIYVASNMVDHLTEMITSYLEDYTRKANCSTCEALSDPGPPYGWNYLLSKAIILSNLYPYKELRTFQAKESIARAMDAVVATGGSITFDRSCLVDNVPLPPMLSSVDIQMPEFRATLDANPAYSIERTVPLYLACNEPDLALRHCIGTYSVLTELAREANANMSSGDPKKVAEASTYQTLTGNLNGLRLKGALIDIGDYFLDHEAYDLAQGPYSLALAYTSEVLTNLEVYLGKVALQPRVLQELYTYNVQPDVWMLSSAEIALKQLIAKDFKGMQSAYDMAESALPDVAAGDMWPGQFASMLIRLAVIDKHLGNNTRSNERLQRALSSLRSDSPEYNNFDLLHDVYLADHGIARRLTDELFSNTISTFHRNTLGADIADSLGFTLCSYRARDRDLSLDSVESLINSADRCCEDGCPSEAKLYFNQADSIAAKMDIDTVLEEVNGRVQGYGYANTLEWAMESMEAFASLSNNELAIHVAAVVEANFGNACDLDAEYEVRSSKEQIEEQYELIASLASSIAAMEEKGFEFVSTSFHASLTDSIHALNSKVHGPNSYRGLWGRDSISDGP